MCFVTLPSSQYSVSVTGAVNMFTSVGVRCIEKVQCDQREADVNSDRARRVADLRGRWSDGKKTLGAPGSLVINTIVCHPSVSGSGLTSRLAILSVGHLFAGLGTGRFHVVLLFSSRPLSRIFQNHLKVQCHSELCGYVCDCVK